MNLVEIESKKTVLTNTKQATLDKVNLALAPLRMQIAQLEQRAHQITVDAVQEIGQLDGRLAQLEELRLELVPPPKPDLKAVPPLGDNGAAAVANS